MKGKLLTGNMPGSGSQPRYALTAVWNGSDREPYQIEYTDEYGNRTIYEKRHK